MTRQTFILILNIYGFLLGFSMLFLPAEAVKYFGGHPENLNEVSLMQFFGVLHIGFNFTAINLRKSLDTKVVKSFLLGIAFVLFASVGTALYGAYVLGIPIHKTAFFDWGLWIVLGIGALYFWSKEKN